jgi:DNA-directed RNA polymerase subunit RPC12/RpoP
MNVNDQHESSFLANGLLKSAAQDNPSPGANANLFNSLFGIARASGSRYKTQDRDARDRALRDSRPMSQFKFYCPHCQQHLECEESLSGRQIQCPNCQVLLRIPPVPGKTAQYSPESGKTWATFVSPANVPPPKSLSVDRKPEPPKKP